MISKLGQVLNFTRKLGQGLQTARRIGSAVNKELGGKLLDNKYGRLANDLSKKALEGVGVATNVLEKAEEVDRRIRRL